MTNTGTRSRVIVNASILSTLTFAYFSALASTLSPNAFSSTAVAIRLGGALVVGFALALRLRDAATWSDAAREGLLLAAIVVVINGLGSVHFGRELAIRTGGVLLGLPVLATLTHVLGRTRTPIAPDE